MTVEPGKDTELVKVALSDIGHKKLPDAGFGAQFHAVGTAIPAVEIAENRNSFRTGRPNREPGA